MPPATCGHCCCPLLPSLWPIMPSPVQQVSAEPAAQDFVARLPASLTTEVRLRTSPFRRRAAGHEAVPTSRGCPASLAATATQLPARRCRCLPAWAATLVTWPLPAQSAAAGAMPWQRTAYGLPPTARASLPGAASGCWHPSKLVPLAPPTFWVQPGSSAIGGGCAWTATGCRGGGACSMCCMATPLG